MLLNRPLQKAKGGASSTLAGRPRSSTLARPSFYRWGLLAALWFILGANLGFPLYGASILNATMVAELGFDKTALGLLFSTFSIMGGLASPLAGWAISHVSARALLSLGSALVAAGSLAMATIVHSEIGAIMSFGVIVGLGSSMGGLVTTQSLATRWFEDRVALALGLLMTASAAGGFFSMLILGSGLIDHSQKMTVAASAMAEKKTVGHRS